MTPIDADLRWYSDSELAHRIRTDDLLRFLALMLVTHDDPHSIEALNHVRAYVEAMVSDQEVAAA